MRRPSKQLLGDMHTERTKAKHSLLEVFTSERRNSIVSTCSEPIPTTIKAGSNLKRRRSSLQVEIPLVSQEPQLKPKIVYEPVLKGNDICPFYHLWRQHSKPKRPLGRGKLELPNSMKLVGKYRECGCPVRRNSRNRSSKFCCVHS